MELSGFALGFFPGFGCFCGSVGFLGSGGFGLGGVDCFLGSGGFGCLRDLGFSQPILDSGEIARHSRCHRSGVALAFSLAIAGQMLVTLLVDHFGWLGVSEKPINLFRVLGAVLMLTTLVVFSSSSGSRPGEGYEPPSYKDGQVTPGHTTRPAP